MTIAQLSSAVRELRVSLDDRSDEHLVSQFMIGRDEIAFATIVRRHGGLVLDVCRSVLRNQTDAEDAFQATFLALATQSQCIRRLAGWLHGTAYRTAQKIRRARNRRRVHEAHAPTRPETSPSDPSWAEVREAIHEEVDRLPGRYREATILFYLVGRTQDEIGHALGLSRDGVKKRLERGRSLLRASLGRRGFGPVALLAATTIVDPTLANAASRLLNTREPVFPVRSSIPNGVKLMSATSFLGALLAVVAGHGEFTSQPDQPTRDHAATVNARSDPAEPEGARHRFTINLTKAEPWPNATRCAFLDDDRILVQPGTSKGLEIRDAKTGKLLKNITVERQFIGDFRLSADRKWVAAATTYDTTGTWTIPSPGVIVWDATTWKIRGTLDDCDLLDMASDGRTVIVTQHFRQIGEGAKVEVWIIVAKKKLKSSPFNCKRIDAGAISPDGSLVVVSDMNEIAYWKWREGDKYDRLSVGRKVDALVFSADGKQVAEGPDSRVTVEVRDVATLKVARDLSDPAQPRIPQTVAGMTFTDSRKTLVFGNGVSLFESIPVPYRIHFWDVRGGKLVRQINLKGGAPSSVAVSPDGKTLAAVTADMGVSLRVFDLIPTEQVLPKK